MIDEFSDKVYFSFSCCKDEGGATILSFMRKLFVKIRFIVYPGKRSTLINHDIRRNSVHARVYMYLKRSSFLPHLYRRLALAYSRENSGVQRDCHL